MPIRDIIIEAASRRNWDYKALAERTGLPRATVHRYWNGKLDLTGARIERLLDALDLGISKKRKRRTVKSVQPLFLEPIAGGRPFFSYPGAKWDVMPSIIPQMPPHHHYVSVFGGSGADILRKSPSKLETFNDLDGHIATIFSLLQDKKKLTALKKKLAATPAQSHATFTEATARINSDDDIEKTWAFLVISYQGWAVETPGKVDPVRWRFCKWPIRTPRRWLTLPDTLDDVAARFRSVQITQWDWAKVLRNTDSKQTLFFLDPPYYRSDNFDLTMPKRKHELLLQTVGRVKGAVILCGHRNRLYDRLLENWRRQRVGQTKGGKAEFIWMNFDEGGVRFK